MVDDFFPCFQDRNEPLFTKPSNDSYEVWPMVVEKCWAKTFKNYINSEKMIVEYAMEDLLGAPSCGFWIKNFTL